uniref:Uncharacterized protein n=1 Tax=Arundo donax TaxID=35708 RepID=A0A0A9BUL9_ARUDO
MANFISILDEAIISIHKPVLHSPVINQPWLEVNTPWQSIP